MSSLEYGIVGMNCALWLGSSRSDHSGPFSIYILVLVISIISIQCGRIREDILRWRNVLGPKR
jgi:hypothetical protein